MEKKLTLGKNKKISGVCSGIAEYLDADPTLIRLLVALLTLFSFGTVILVYIIAAIIMPKPEN